MTTLAQYQKMSAAQKKKLKRDDLERLLDDSLDTDVSTSSLRDMIKETISQTIDEKLNVVKEQLRSELNGDIVSMQTSVQTLQSENNLLKRVMGEQQRFLEQIRSDKTKENAFVTGLPCTMTINETESTDVKAIVHAALKVADPNITTESFEILKSFDAREGKTRHSVKLKFRDLETKGKVMKNAKNIVNLADEHPLRRVFIRYDQPPLTNRENQRLYSKLRDLRTADSDHEHEYKITRGVLYQGTVEIDRFNISNQLFQ